MGIGAAIAGGTAVAGLGGSLISANASKSAANQQQQADEQSIALQQQEFNTDQNNLTPFRQYGQTSNASLLNANGSNGPGVQQEVLNQYGIPSLTFQPTQAQLAATPGYQFDLAQGLQSTANANAAQGRGISGAALKGAASYATGLANNTLQTQDQIFQNNLSNFTNNVLNPLYSSASLGENAAANAGSQGVQSASNIGNTLVGQGNAAAAGTVGSSNALAGGFSAAANAPLNYQLYSQLVNNSNGGGGGLTTGETNF